MIDPRKAVWANARRLSALLETLLTDYPLRVFLMAGTSLPAIARAAR